MNDTAKIRFEIPDGPPEEQIKQIRDLIEVVQVAGKLTGEKVDVTPFEEKIKELEKKL